MNDKFFALPIEKQRRIINAAYRVFSENSYKKAPMSEMEVWLYFWDYYHKNYLEKRVAI